MQSVLDEVDYTVDNGLPPTIENEEDMKLREEDKPWFRNEISEAIRGCMAEEIAPLVERRLEKSWRFKAWPVLLNVGVIGIVVAIILTLLSLAATEHSAATTRAANEAKFEQKTTDDFTSVNEQLKGIRSAIRVTKLTTFQ
jgi:hypothetical protein